MPHPSPTFSHLEWSSQALLASAWILCAWRAEDNRCPLATNISEPEPRSVSVGSLPWQQVLFSIPLSLSKVSCLLITCLITVWLSHPNPQENPKLLKVRLSAPLLFTQHGPIRFHKTGWMHGILHVDDELPVTVSSIFFKATKTVSEVRYFLKIIILCYMVMNGTK